MSDDGEDQDRPQWKLVVVMILIAWLVSTVSELATGHFLVVGVSTVFVFFSWLVHQKKR